MSASIRDMAAGIKKRGGKALVPYFMGLWPDAASFHGLVLGSVRAGADAVEIGVPFSDPVADGPLIQAAGREALSKGAAPPDVFRETARIACRTDAPVVLMTYANPVLRMGADRFFAAAAQSGASGVIVPDAPLEESDGLRGPAAAAGIELIPMICRGAPESRIEAAAARAGAFLYLVALKGVTGPREGWEPDVAAEVATARRFSAVPVYAGFGISSAGQAASAASQADGAVVGSALIGAYRSGGPEAVFGLIRAMRRAIDGDFQCAFQGGEKCGCS